MTTPTPVVIVTPLPVQLPPDEWAAATAYGTWATAIATFVLALGVVVAILQLRDQRRTNRIVTTPELIKGWYGDNLPAGRAKLDKYADLEKNRDRVNSIYLHSRGSTRRTFFGKFRPAARAFIHQTARITERIEIYVRRGAADEGVIVEHLGYSIVMTYYALQDVLKILAKTESRDYEGWRLLALRCQAYAKLHPRDTNMWRELVWAELPLIEYENRSTSQAPKLSRWLRFRLKFVRRPADVATPDKNALKGDRFRLGMGQGL